MQSLQMEGVFVVVVFVVFVVVVVVNVVVVLHIFSVFWSQLPSSLWVPLNVTY